MSFEEDEWRDDEHKAAVERQRRHVPELTRMRQAAVPQEFLVASEGWDYFLSLVQESLDAFYEQKADIVALLTSPNTQTSDQLWALRCDAVAIEASLSALRAVRNLPKLIINDADKAKAMMEKLSESAEV